MNPGLYATADSFCWLNLVLMMVKMSEIAVLARARSEKLRSTAPRILQVCKGWLSLKRVKTFKANR